MQHLADRFAATARERFSDPALWRWSEDGFPFLTDVLARVSGRVEHLLLAGDSLVALALVEHAYTGTGRPLVHHPTTTGPMRSASAPPTGSRPPEAVETFEEQVIPLVRELEAAEAPEELAG